MKNVRKRVYDKVFETQIFFVLGEDKEFLDDCFSKWMRIKGEVPISDKIGLACRLTEKNGATSYLLYMKKPRLETLIHELVHIVNMIFQEKEVFYDYKEHEVFSYYLEFWVRELAPLLNNSND